MGVDSIVRFNHGVKIKDVADVVAILLGRPKTWMSIDTPGETVEETTEPTKMGWMEVKDISFKPSPSPELVEIGIGKIPEMYGDGWWLTYYFEDEKGPHMSGSSRAERIALHRALAKFFGGTVDYDDSDSKDADFQHRSPAWLNKGSNRAYHAKQMAKWDLQPITKEEIKKCRQWAAY